MKRTIFTMGGGGFSEEPENLLLDQYFFSLAKKDNPNVCFIGTASGDAEAYIEQFYNAMKRHTVKASHLSLFRGEKGSLRDFILSQDVIYVGGGNTRNLIVLWKEWGLDKILREAYEAGKVMGGVSAGSLCWYEDAVTDSVPGQLSSLHCLGFLKGSNCPHYDSEKNRRPEYHRFIQQGMKDGVACDDGVAAVFENENFLEFVSSRPNGSGYFVKNSNGKVDELRVKTRYLGA